MTSQKCFVSVLTRYQFPKGKSAGLVLKYFGIIHSHRVWQTHTHTHTQTHAHAPKHTYTYTHIHTVNLTTNLAEDTLTKEIYCRVRPAVEPNYGLFVGSPANPIDNPARPTLVAPYSARNMNSEPK